MIPMHLVYSEPFDDRKKFIERKRFPRLLPFGIVFVLFSIAAVPLGILPWIKFTFFAITMVLIVLIIWQEFSRMLDLIEYPDCAICGSPGHLDLFQKDNLAMVKCSDCGQVYARPRFASFRRWVFLQLFSLRDAIKVAGTKQLSDPNTDASLDSRFAVIEKYFNQLDSSNFIDIGCACGELLVMARRKGSHVSGIEPGFFGALCGRYKYGLNIHNTHLERFSPVIKYDVVCCFHVIEHVASPLDFLISIAGLLGSQSFLILATPNFGCKRAKELGPEWEGAGPSDHIFLFDENSLTNLCHKAGLRIINSLSSRENQNELVFLICPDPCM